MIHLFCPWTEANKYLSEHPRERVVAISPGHLSGSVMVATELSESPSPEQAIPPPPAGMTNSPVVLEKRGPGRPRKVGANG